MTELLGNYGLSGAVLLASAALLLAIASIRFDSQRLLQTARVLLGLLAALLTVSCICLLVALIHSDFRFKYVAEFTERTLPGGFKVAAFWAGQEGSLLLWGWMVAFLSALAVYQWRQRIGTEQAAITAALAVICGFFATLLLFAANPFVTATPVPADGHGLNPMLQDPAMIAHPPLLFLGYAGFTIPFAILLGALISNRQDNFWVSDARRWVLIAWLFLTAGIVLGAEWAYVELGWGGYWAWDPVENASLLPWFTATALLHSIMVQQRRGMFKLWNAVLMALTFILCIFGTYLTRSNIVQSVHTFGASLIGTFFLVFLLTCLVVSGGVIFWRKALLQPTQALEGLIGREGAFLALNALMMLMMLATLVGTIYPVLSGLFTSEPITVKPEFYNKVIVPMGILALAFMAVGPLLFYGADAAAKLARRIIVPALGAALAGGIAWGMGLHNAWALICVAVAVLAVLSIAVDFTLALLSRIQTTGENLFVATQRMAAVTHRRYGAQITHVGMILIMAGVAGSSLFKTAQTFPLQPKQSAAFGDCTLTLQSLEEKPHGNHVALEAVLTLTNAQGVSQTFRPQIRIFNKFQEAPNREVSILSDWRRDIYVVFAGLSENETATVQILVNPLVSWIWIGALVMLVGGLICLIPVRTLPQKQTVSAVESSPTSKPHKSARIVADPALKT